MIHHLGAAPAYPQAVKPGQMRSIREDTERRKLWVNAGSFTLRSFPFSADEPLPEGPLLVSNERMYWKDGQTLAYRANEPFPEEELGQLISETALSKILRGAG